MPSGMERVRALPAERWRGDDDRVDDVSHSELKTGRRRRGGGAVPVIRAPTRTVRSRTSIPLVLLGALVTGCGSRQPALTAGGHDRLISDTGPQHVHGLGVNPADGSLLIATHSGLWRTASLLAGIPMPGTICLPGWGFNAPTTGQSFARRMAAAPCARSEPFGEPPEAFAAAGPTELYAAVGKGEVLASRDGGASWRTRSTP
jgi:hypothetical protein